MGDSTIWLGCTPILRGNTLGAGQRHPIYFPLPRTSREDLRLDENLEYLLAVQALYANKHRCLLWDSNPDTAVSVTNQYT
ncbi:hypothetical protein TNCV_2975781 [Trichonephila clavipes]|nr:hypothetical protein TNCV_2975781 [Trichonephila clavipes]